MPNESSTSSSIVKLSIGGKLFLTTKTTLSSKGDNFFTALLSERVPSTRDENGAFFVDRNGDFFGPILDYLRTGSLYVPKGISLDAVLQEASYYCIDLSEGICPILPGLYSSCSSSPESSSWMLFIQKDASRFPDLVAVTGVLDERLLLQKICKVLPGGVIEIIHTQEHQGKADSSSSNCFTPLRLFVSLNPNDPDKRTLECRADNEWDLANKLSWRCEPQFSYNDFPLPLSQRFCYARYRSKKSHPKSIIIFEKTEDNQYCVKIECDSVTSIWSLVPLCRTLMMVRGLSGSRGLIYLSGGVVFFMEGNTPEDFTVQALKKMIPA